MPTNRKRRRVRRRGQAHTVNTWQALDLLYGYTYFIEDTLDDEAFADAWDAHCAVIMTWWLSHRVGSRPFGWWVCESPEYGPRLLTEYGQQTLTEEDRQRGIYHTCTIPPRQESQYAYLERHGLLTDGERSLLADPAFRWRDDDSELLRLMGIEV